MKMSVTHRVRTLAVRTLLVTAGPGSALAADGTIHFVGAIVAAAYASSVHAPPATTGKVKTGARSELVFERQWIDRPSARVAVRALGDPSLVLGFTDGQGRRHALASAQEQVIGRDGGSLSLAPVRSGGPATAALVTISYD